MLDVKFEKRADKFLQKLPIPITQRIVSKIMRARENPFNFFEKLTDRDDFRMRVGDYRIIADIDTNNNTIYIRLIGHRRNIYER